MNHVIKLLIYTFLLSFNVYASKSSDLIHDNRVKIGPITTAPIDYKGSLYFLANTGTLFKSNYDQSVITNIFSTAKSTFSGLTLSGDVIYFGEGLHEDKESHLYAYNLKEKKLIFKLAFKGHIERKPLIHKNILYLGLGPHGISAVDLKTKSVLWTQEKFEKNILHIDATPIVYKRGKVLEICVPSIYQFKALVCLDARTGHVLFSEKLLLSPKSEMEMVGDYIMGYATEGNMVNNEFKTPTRFYIYNLAERKLIKEVNLRGYNFFAPLPIKNDKERVFVTLSTGDLITITLKTGKIGYVSEFPEPFISTPFQIKDELCAIGVMGKLLCFKKTKTGYAISKEKRYYESPIGVIGKEIKGNFYIPSRMGYFNL